LSFFIQSITIGCGKENYKLADWDLKLR